MEFFRYIPPPGHPLHPYLDSIWSCDARGEYSSETILPKGNLDILFNLGDRIGFTSVEGAEEGTEAGGLQNLPYLAGFHTGAFRSLPKGGVRLMGVSLKIEACSALLPLPTEEITDLIVDATPLLEGATEVMEQVYEAPDFARRCEILTGWLMRMVQPDERGEIIRTACRSLSNSPTTSNLDRIANQMNISSRHLRRIFLQHLGVSPSQYIRFSRFIQAIHMMGASDTLTDIALATHYFDQAHFCRDFKEIAGMTPTEYREQAGHVPGHIFTP